MDRTKSIDDLRKDVILKEYDRVCADIRGYESYTDRIVGLGFTLLSIGLTVGVAQKVAVVFFILPIALIGVLAYAVMNARWVRELGAYKEHLEYKLNKMCGEEILIWEKLVLENVSTNSSFVALWAVYFIVSVTIFYVSITSISAAYGGNIAHAMAAVLLLLSTIFFIGLRELINVPTIARRKIAQMAQKSASYP